MALPNWIPKPIKWVINRFDDPFDFLKESLDFRVICLLGSCYQIRIHNANMPDWDEDNYNHFRKINCKQKESLKNLYLTIRELRRIMKNSDIDWEKILIGG